MGYWDTVWQQFKSRMTGVAGLLVVLLFVIVGLYAPFLASGKPIIAVWDGSIYFPLFRYLFYRGYYTKALDLFFNIAMFTAPLTLILLLWAPQRWRRSLILGVMTLLQIAIFAWLLLFPIKDPSANAALSQKRRSAAQTGGSFYNSWEQELSYLNDYAKLNMVLEYVQRRNQHNKLMDYAEPYLTAKESQWLKEQEDILRARYTAEGVTAAQMPDAAALRQQVLQETPPDILLEKVALPTLWYLQRHNENEIKDSLRQRLNAKGSESTNKDTAKRLQWLEDKQRWLQQQSGKLSFTLWPLLRPFHWEEDAAGSQSLNKVVTMMELTRINRKDMTAALLFGVRISLVVGIIAVALALAIGVPVGALAGYYGGNFDIVVSRLLEIWEAMPSFLMLLMVVAIAQSKSIFLVIFVIGLFGWTGFSRYIRAEFFKQRNLAYVEACHSLGYGDGRIIFRHILPNAVPPLLTLLPFAVMGAVTSEAGLSFLGLGEEGSCSWGVLMNEGRNAFPGESYLLWPPAILLTVLLVAVALVGDALRDALDPKLHR